MPTNSWWASESFDISDKAGTIQANGDTGYADVRIRFSLAYASGQNVASGWFVDNLKINLIRINADDTEEEVRVLYNIRIFNRYGNLVYESIGKNTEEIWNGSWKGKDAPDGTYFYNMNIQIEGEEGTKTQKGWIQLIR